MEENVHCDSPEKLSLLAFCLSINSLCARRSPRQRDWVQRERAVQSPRTAGPRISWLEPWDRQKPGESGMVREIGGAVLKSLNSRR